MNLEPQTHEVVCHEYQRLDNAFERTRQLFETRLNMDILPKTKLVVLLRNVKERLLPLLHRVRLLHLRLLLYMILLEMEMLMPPKRLVICSNIIHGCTASTLLQCLFINILVTKHPAFPDSSNNNMTVRTLPCTTCQQHSITESDQLETSLRNCRRRPRKQCVMLLPRECRLIKLPLDESLLRLSGLLALQCRPFPD